MPREANLNFVYYLCVKRCNLGLRVSTLGVDGAPLDPPLKIDRLLSDINCMCQSEGE